MAISNLLSVVALSHAQFERLALQSLILYFAK